MLRAGCGNSLRFYNSYDHDEHVSLKYMAHRRRQSEYVKFHSSISRVTGRIGGRVSGAGGGSSLRFYNSYDHDEHVSLKYMAHRGRQSECVKWLAYDPYTYSR